MVPESSRYFLAGIWLTHVGYPLPHRQKGVLDCIRCDRLVFLSFVAVPDAKDDEVGELVFLSGDVREVRTFSDGVAEGAPLSKDFAASGFCLGGVGGGCDLQSRAEMMTLVVPRCTQCSAGKSKKLKSRSGSLRRHSTALG
jgi:hypothetical protein